MAPDIKEVVPAPTEVPSDTVQQVLLKRLDHWSARYAAWVERGRAVEAAARRTVRDLLPWDDAVSDLVAGRCLTHLLILNPDNWLEREVSDETVRNIRDILLPQDLFSAFKEAGRPGLVVPAGLVDALVKCGHTLPASSPMWRYVADAEDREIETLERSGRLTDPQADRVRDGQIRALRKVQENRRTQAIRAAKRAEAAELAKTHRVEGEPIEELITRLHR